MNKTSNLGRFFIAAATQRSQGIAAVFAVRIGDSTLQQSIISSLN
jgi:hypothetical protein